MRSSERVLLVPTDFSPPADHALRYASNLAARTGARLTLMHSDAFAPAPETVAAGIWEDTTRWELEELAHERLLESAEKLVDPTVAFDALICIGKPVDAIVEQAAETRPSMIVMGTHGRTGIRRFIIGSVTETVMRAADAPVLGVPEAADEHAGMAKIICVAAYEAACVEGLLAAETIAPVDARFVVVRAIDRAELAEAADEFRELRGWVPQRLLDRCDFRIFTMSRLGEQIEAYTRSSGADLIVAAEPPSLLPRHAVYGTFADRLVQHAVCPVLTVNPKAIERRHRVAATLG